MKPFASPGMLRQLSWGLLLCALLFRGMPAFGQAVRDNFVEAELVPEHLAWVPGEHAWVALRLKHDPHWHTYWRNPGDAGAPTRIRWALPPGFEAGPIEWPVPQRIPVPPLQNYGYDGEVLLLVPIDVPKDALFGHVTLGARVDWLMCKDVCIPGGADLQLKLPVVQGSPAPNQRWTAAFAATRDALPKEIEGLRASARGQGKSIDLTVPLTGTIPGGIAPREAYFFSAVDRLVDPSRPQSMDVHEGVLHITLPVAVDLAANRKLLDGVLVTSPPLWTGARAVSLSAMIDGPVVAGEPRSPGISSSLLERELAGATGSGRSLSGDTLTLGLALIFAFVGGLVLNLMPCVFPVISIKILGFAERAHHDVHLLRTQGAGFAAGVVLSFAAFGLAVIALRGSSAALGWGFQLQTPAVVIGLAALFMLLGLNLFGVYEVLLPVPVAGKRQRGLHPVAAAFGSGILAAAVASPCTAPFMGAALGFALTQAAPTGFAVFVVLGAGMALPYLVLSWFPAWLRRLPRPGQWLLRLRELLAFPLFATVIWLLWVLAQQVGIDGAARGAAGLLALGLAAWLWGLAQRGAAPWVRACGVVSALAGFAIAASSLSPASEPAKLAGSEWQPFSETEIARLQTEGRPVFVDFTAAWCVTCQVNKKLVLEQPAIVREFAERSVVLMRADWTRRDESITQALKALGRNGVPVYVLYRPDGTPLLLPELLQQRDVLEALATLTPPLKAARQ